MDYIERGPPPGQIEIRDGEVVRVYFDEILPVSWKKAWEHLDKKEQEKGMGY